MAGVSAGSGAVEHERRGLVGRQLACLEQVRVEVLGAGHVAALPAPLPVVVEHEEARLAEPRGDLRDRELANVHIVRLAPAQAASRAARGSSTGRSPLAASHLRSRHLTCARGR